MIRIRYSGWKERVVIRKQNQHLTPLNWQHKAMRAYDTIYSTYFREGWTYCYIPVARDEKSRAEMWVESVDSQGKGGMGWFANESKIM